MRKWAPRVLALTTLLVLMSPVLAGAQQPIKIAIWDFENNAERSWWFHDDLGPAVRNQLDTAFSENEELSRMFAVVEREKLDLVMKEQGLGAAGALDPQSAATIGRILGVKYIVTGAVDRFSINRTSGSLNRFGGVGGNMVSAEALINMRFIDTTTALRVVALSGEGGVKKGGGFFKGARLSRDAEWGIASEAIEKASGSIVAKLVSGNYLQKVATAAGPVGTAGRIIKVDGDRAWINLGSSSGIKLGDRFTIIHMGEDLIDPDTGAKLGADEEETGKGEVTEVQEKFAVMRFTGAAQAKDTIRK
jgi:curli biogenesis system outer membrane secretion channel CsgG